MFAEDVSEELVPWQTGNNDTRLPARVKEAVQLRDPVPVVATRSGDAGRPVHADFGVTEDLEAGAIDRASMCRPRHKPRIIDQSSRWFANRSRFESHSFLFVFVRQARQLHAAEFQGAGDEVALRRLPIIGSRLYKPIGFKNFVPEPVPSNSESPEESVMAP